jgi:hypothetical protein
MMRYRLAINLDFARFVTCPDVSFKRVIDQGLSCDRLTASLAFSFAEGISSTHICGASPSHYEFSRGGNGGSRMGGGIVRFRVVRFRIAYRGRPPGGGSFLLSKHRLSLGDLSPEMIDAIATLEHFKFGFGGCIMKLNVGRTSSLEQRHRVECGELHTQSLLGGFVDAVGGEQPLTRSERPIVAFMHQRPVALFARQLE